MQNGKKRNLDKILIENLLLRCIIGIDDLERREKQDVVINIVMWCDLARAAEADDIRKTVDYKKVNKSIVKLVEKSQFFLVETLAENVANMCLQHGGVKKVRVTVEKPGALRFARSVGVEITREKG
jgi:FolB domain-containing protein